MFVVLASLAEDVFGLRRFNFALPPPTSDRKFSFGLGTADSALLTSNLEYSSLNDSDIRFATRFARTFNNYDNIQAEVHHVTRNALTTYSVVVIDVTIVKSGS